MKSKESQNQIIRICFVYISFLTDIWNLTYVMTEKEGNEYVIAEIIGKSEKMGENLTNEDASASFETIHSETPLVRNGVQINSKDKAKSKRFLVY